MKTTKPYFIYYFNTAEQKAERESGHQAYILSALNEIDAIKQWHIHLNGNSHINNFFRNSTYHAVPAI